MVIFSLGASTLSIEDENIPRGHHVLRHHLLSAVGGRFGVSLLDAIPTRDANNHDDTTTAWRRHHRPSCGVVVVVRWWRSELHRRFGRQPPLEDDDRRVSIIRDCYYFHDGARYEPAQGHARLLPRRNAPSELVIR